MPARLCPKLWAALLLLLAAAANAELLMVYSVQVRLSAAFERGG